LSEWFGQDSHPRRVEMKIPKLLRLLAALLLACMLMGTDDCDSEADRQAGRKIENANTLMERQPAPEINYSMDRFLLSERLARFNDPNKMTYLYVILPDGSWLQVTIVGKLASTSKRLTSPDQYSGASGYHFQAPDEMATYGSSEPAKVGMTTLGSLLEIGGFLAYLYSEAPLTFKGLNKPPIEIEVVASRSEISDFNRRLESAQRR